MDTEQEAVENTQQQLPANNSGTAQEISPKSRLIAFLLCTFAGYVGAHNFYVGRIRRGIIQLLLIVSSFIVYFCSLLYLVLSNVDNPDAADAVFVGSDWKGTEAWNQYEKDFAEVGCTVVYLDHTDGISSSMLREKISK